MGRQDTRPPALERIDGGGVPSAENLAIWIYEQWIDEYPELTAVKVCETAKTMAEYRPEPQDTRAQ